MSDLVAYLQAHEEDLVSYLARHAGWILRYETVEDLLQGLHLRMLERGGEFDYRGREAFLKWIYAVARTFLADRSDYWSALKRKSAGLLRLTSGGTPSDPRAIREPAGTRTGPSTFASRREQLAQAVRALAVLLPRDRDLVRWSSEDVPLEEQAGRLGITYNALKQARFRALERYRKAYALLSGQAGM